MMMEPKRGIHRWVDTDDEIKPLILKDALRLRPRPWSTMSRMIENVYHVRVSKTCLRIRLTPGEMEKQKRRVREYCLRYPERRAEQVRQYWNTHREMLDLRRKMLEGKMKWAVV